MTAQGLETAAAALLREAGELLRDRERAAEVRAKGRTDFVTAVDTRVQAFLRDALAELDPGVQFMAEEKDNAAIDPARPVWILDPVDGTTNFIHDFQHSVISLACSERGRITSGIVYDPYRRECFEAQEGQGALLNKKPIVVSGAAELSQCLIAMGTSPGHRERADESFRKMRAVYDRCQDIRRVGSAALELCYVACGRLDGFFEERLKLWDYGAAGLILREAGGWIQADERQVAAGTPGIREELLGLVGDETDKKLYSSDREGM